MTVGTDKTPILAEGSRRHGSRIRPILIFGDEIAYIVFEDTDRSYNIHIKKNNEVLPWKKFNSNMAVSIEYDLEY